VVANLLADLTYPLLDPRVDLAQAGRKLRVSQPQTTEAIA
jgi:hypothetical protein